MSGELFSDHELIDRIGDIYKRLLTIGTHYWDRAFTMIFFIFFALLLIATFQYNPTTRLFPLVIGIPTFIFAGILLVTQFSSRAAELASTFSTSDVFEFEEQVEQKTAEHKETNTNNRGDVYSRRNRLVVISLWMISLFVLVILIGILPASVVFLLGFYLIYTDCGWMRSIIYTATFTLFIIVVFGIVMGMRFYQGLFGIGLPF